MSIPQDLRDDLNRLYLLEKKSDDLKKQIGTLKQSVLFRIKKHNLQNFKFNYGDRTYKYKHDTSKKSITQCAIEKSIKKYYPSLNYKTFIMNAKTFIDNKNQVRLETIRKK